MTHTNLGAVTLAAKVQDSEESIRAAAKRLKHDFACVYRWLKEGQLPEYRGRKACLDEYGVPMEYWDQSAQIDESKGAA